MEYQRFRPDGRERCVFTSCFTVSSPNCTPLGFIFEHRPPFKSQTEPRRIDKVYRRPEYPPYPSRPPRTMSVIRSRDSPRSITAHLH